MGFQPKSSFEFETELEYSINIYYITSFNTKVMLGIAWLGGADGDS